MRHSYKFYLKKGLRTLRTNIPFIIGLFLLFLGGVALWASTLKLPDLSSPENIRISESTKIYDRTGKVVLFDLNGEVRRTAVEGTEMSPWIRLAAVAIEDESFYTHNGIKVTSIIRSVFTNILNLGYAQGGSTITQQVIKNSLLTREKTITRKIKEWILAIKLERIMSKEDILTLYLNSSPYGGNIYGIEEASRVFFGKKAIDLTLTEAAYMAALPQAPTYYSPYGNHRDRLEERKNLVLKQMLKNGFIKEDEYEKSKSEKITFAAPENSGIKAAHFVMFVREQLEELFSEEELEEGGLKVITTLDYELQVKAEEILKKGALENAKKFNAENAALVAIDPKTGDILTMVGSRDYFDKEIDGNYNIATALRQPGSSFKPIVYAAAFEKGYLPQTVLWDVPTEFSTSCSLSDNPDLNKNCYRPGNYDGSFRGPMTLKNALAQSINIPAVKVLYLVGMNSAINLAENMGITSFSDPSRYGLSLVLGGGEVRLVDLVSAYSVFAAEGIRNPYQSILKIEDKKGKVLKEAESNPKRVLNENTALQISDILSDDDARAPLYGSRSTLYFAGRSVAAKTGTTNDYRDAWIVGYTPNIAVGMWAGNNDNRSMEKKISGLIVTPMWREFMLYALSKQEEVPFRKPEPVPENIKPIIRGDYMSDGPHSILYYVDKDNPLGDKPRNPARDPQYRLWEEGIQNWVTNSSSTLYSNINEGFEGNNTNNYEPNISILSPVQDRTYTYDTQIPVVLSLPSGYNVSKADVYINSRLVGSFSKNPFTFSFIPEDIRSIRDNNRLKVTLYDSNNKKTEVTTTFKVE